MSYILLFFGFFVLLEISWIVNRKDVLSPNVIINLSFIGALFLFVLSMDRFGIKSLSTETVFLLISATAVFMLGNALGKSKKHNTIAYSGLMEEVTKPKLALLFLVVFTIFALIVAIIQFQYMRSVVGNVYFASLMYYFRSKSLANELPQHIVVVIGSRIVYALQPILIYFLVYQNYVCRKKVGNKYIVITLAILYAISIYIISGSRGRIFQIIFQYLFSYIICYKTRCVLFGKKVLKQQSWKKLVLLSILAIIPIFYYVGSISGKKYDEISAFESVSNYFTYGLFRLDNFLKGEQVLSEHFGQWSFPGIYSLFNKLGGNYGNYDNFPFYENYGNTSTIYGRWYVDFGYIGVYVLALWNGFLYSLFYNRMKYATTGKNAFVASVIFIFMMGNILMASYDDWTRSLYTINGSLQLLLIIFLSKRLYIYSTRKNK